MNITPYFNIDASPLIQGDLDGSQGINRAPAQDRHTSANTDYQAIVAWLYKFKNSSCTFSNYRKEAQRLYNWALNERHKPISSLLYEDLVLYWQFLANPPAHYISATKHPLSSPSWRPFSKPLSPASVNQAADVINALFKHLVEIGYLRHNPVKLSREKTTRQKTKRYKRYIQDETWEAILAFLDTLPESNKRQSFYKIRAKWVITLFYRTGMRISETLTNNMGSLVKHRGRYWLDITGKGSKERLVPASSDLIEAMQRYRAAMGLPSTPAPKEQTPFIIKRWKCGGTLHRTALHDFLKDLFRRTDVWLAAQNSPLAGSVERVSAHWLRHTAATHWLRSGASLQDVRETLGHEDISTTGGYVHSEDDERHDAIERAADFFPAQ